MVQELLTFKANTHSVAFVAFSPDGHWLASNANDNNAFAIWDATPLPEKP